MHCFHLCIVSKTMFIEFKNCLLLYKIEIYIYNPRDNKIKK